MQVESGEVEGSGRIAGRVRRGVGVQERHLGFINILQTERGQKGLLHEDTWSSPYPASPSLQYDI